jgi:hypothetical protein
MESFGVCLLTLIPMRAQASDKSEMVSQVLFGETYKVLDQKGKWILIQLQADGYEGWIDSLQHQPLTETQALSYAKEDCMLLNELTAMHMPKQTGTLILSFGSALRPSLKVLFPEFMHNFPAKEFESTPNAFDADKMAAAARKLEGTTYVWGGKSVFGIDCSGFTQICAKAAGYQLFRDANQQAAQGEIVDFLEEAKSGDLAFFDNEEGNIIHVGILLSPNQIIHASGSVRVDMLDHHGIFNKQQNKYTHKLRLIKSLTP